MKNLVLAAVFAAAATLASPALADEVSDRNQALALCRTAACKEALLLEKIDPRAARSCLLFSRWQPSWGPDTLADQHFWICFDGTRGLGNVATLN